MNCLVESALMTHGLVSITNDELAGAWVNAHAPIAWIDAGEIKIGSIDEFIPFRDRSAELCRIDKDMLQTALDKKISGALTASGTMALCARMGIPLAVSCGIGTVSDIKGEELCPDMPALRDIPVTLLATAWKDMMDTSATLSWFRENGVRVLGINTQVCAGYIFNDGPTELDGAWQGVNNTLPCPGKLLLLNPIPAHDRLPDRAMLKEGIRLGKQAEREGRYYHPAANAAFDRLSGGLSSQIQLKSLVANAILAEKLV